MIEIRDKLKQYKIANYIYYTGCALISAVRCSLYPVNRKLIKYKNLHEGKRCFVVATGPSLTINDLEKLKGEICFSMNSIINSFDKTTWRPRYYGITDDIPFNMLKDKIDVTQFEQVFLANNIGRLKQECIYMRFNDYYRSLSMAKGSCKGLIFPSDRVEKYYINGTSVTFMLIQLAYYMGFKEIYLLGQDCSFLDSIQHSTIANINYNKKPGEMEGIYLIEIFENYKKWFDEHGIKIFNATRGGKLEVFPRIDLDALLEDC